MGNRAYKDGILVWIVGLQSNITGKKVELEVTGETNKEATTKCIKLLGYNGDYKWLGTGPLYV